MNTKSQTEAVLKYLESGKSLTALDALQLFGCMRLGARCWELKQAGHKIISSRTKTPSGKYVAEYSLEK